jgi:hypothetical protein
MKFILLLLVMIAGTAGADAQSLKEALYKGKLKKDSTSVIRKTDDLSTKMVDTTKKVELVQVDTIAVIRDSAMVKNIQAGKIGDTATSVTTSSETTQQVDTASKLAAAAGVAAVAGTVVETSDPLPPPVPVKSNNKIWKELTDSLITNMKTDVIANKKVKKETYFLTAEYEISETGEVSIVNVLVSPENEFLSNQVKDRLITSPPALAPVVDSSGKARKVKRKYNFTITKE